MPETAVTDIPKIMDTETMAAVQGRFLREHVLATGWDGAAETLETNLALLPALGRHFERSPAKIGVVSSSIAYEADIVLREVFRALREEVDRWLAGAERRDRAAAGFDNYRAFYDACVTASDSSEIRLKPHRDLYCIALHKMRIGPEELDRVVGFEDSESGIIGIRAAGVGLCVAVPFKDTEGHDFSAAAFRLRGGLPEALLGHLHFLDPAALETDRPLR